MAMMKGWKMFSLGAAVAAVPAILSYAGGFDWTSFGVSPEAGAAIGGAILVLRWFTDTPMFSRVLSAVSGGEVAVEDEEK